MFGVGDARPLWLPTWLVEPMTAKGVDVDAMARANGFDGYVTPGPYPDHRPPLEPGEPNRAQ